MNWVEENGSSLWDLGDVYIYLQRIKIRPTIYTEPMALNDI